MDKETIKEQPKWKRIAKGDRLPCDAVLMKNDGTILAGSGAGAKLGQDAYYLPVEELKSFPKEESEDEGICRKLIDFLKLCKTVYGDGFKQFGLDVDDALDWLEIQDEQKYTKKDIDDAYLKGVCDAKHELEKQGKHQEYPKDVIDNAISFLANRNDGMPEKEAKDIVNAIITVLNPSYWPKQDEQKLVAWSEEDEKYMQSIVEDLEFEKKRDGTLFGAKVMDEHIEWLKSLKDRCTWKPTAEQMRVLEWCKPLFAEPESKAILESLIDDLKKLKE